MTDIAWPELDAYQPVAKGRPKVEAKAKALTYSVSEGPAGGGKLNLSLSPDLVTWLGWKVGDPLALHAHEGDGAVFLRLTPSTGAPFALRPAPNKRANGPPSRSIVHLGRCGGIALPIGKAKEAAHRRVLLTSDCFALELVIDAAPRTAAKPAAPKAPSPAVTKMRPNVEAAVTTLARTMRGEGEPIRRIISEIKRVHGVSVDEDWVARAVVAKRAA